MDAIVIYVWLAVLTIAQLAQVLLMLEWRKEGKLIQKQMGWLRINDKLDAVLEAARRGELKRNEQMAHATRTLLDALKKESTLLTERHWLAIRAIEQLMP